MGKKDTPSDQSGGGGAQPPRPADRVPLTERPTRKIEDIRDTFRPPPPPGPPPPRDQND